MKIKFNIRDVISRSAHHDTLMLAHVELDELFELNDIKHEQEINIHALLAEQKAIALIWDAEMLVSQYPHLTEEQAWDVLQECSMSYSAENGLTWDNIAEHVFDQYPDAEETKQRLAERLRSLLRQVEALPDDDHRIPAAYGKVAAKIDDAEQSVQEVAHDNR